MKEQSSLSEGARLVPLWGNVGACPNPGNFGFLNPLGCDFLLSDRKISFLSSCPPKKQCIP